MIELSTKLEDHHEKLKVLMPHIFHFNTEKLKDTLNRRRTELDINTDNIILHNNRYFTKTCPLGKPAGDSAVTRSSWIPGNL